MISTQGGQLPLELVVLRHRLDVHAGLRLEADGDAERLRVGEPTADVDGDGERDLCLADVAAGGARLHLGLRAGRPGRGESGTDTSRP